MNQSFTTIARVYAKNADALYRYFYYKTLSQSDAEDLTSETFLEFSRSVVEKKQMRDETKYLYGIAKHVFLKFLRKKYADNEISSVLSYYEQLDPYIHITEYTQTMEALPTLEERAQYFITQLPEKQKQIVTMRLIDKMTPTEIANQLGKDTNYVKTTLKRGMRSLKTIVACTPAPTTITEQ